MNSPDSKRITLNDVAELAGVSSQTVSRVVNDYPHVAETTRRRVLDAINQLDYRPNRAARNLATQRSCMLGIIIYDLHNYGPAQMVNNVERTAKARGYGVSLSTVDNVSRIEIRQAIDYLGDQLVDGLVLITPTIGISYKDLTQVCGGLPFVQVYNELPTDVPSVVIDQRLGSQQVTQHLIDRGHQTVCEISGPYSWYGAQTRHDSWRDTLLLAGLTPSMSLEGDWSAKSGYEATHQIIATKTRFTALVAGNDQMALGALCALREHGLRIPEDVSVVGFDDIPEAAYFYPPLTTVQQNFAALGEQAVEYLVSLINNPDTPIHQRVLYPRLIERQSTQPVG